MSSAARKVHQSSTVFFTLTANVRAVVFPSVMVSPTRQPDRKAGWLKRAARWIFYPFPSLTGRYWNQVIVSTSVWLLISAMLSAIMAASMRTAEEQRAAPPETLILVGVIFLLSLGNLPVLLSIPKRKFHPLTLAVFLIWTIYLVLDYYSTLQDYFPGFLSGFSSALILNYLIVLIGFLTIWTFALLAMLDALPLLQEMILLLLKRTENSFNPDIRSFIPKILGISIGQQNRCLKDLALTEIQMVKSWAAANQENTEKRLLPISIILAIGGILLTISFSQFSPIVTVLAGFKTAFESASPVLSTFLYLLQVGIIGVATAFVLYWAILIVRLFDNLTVQGMIIEICIALEYAREEGQPD